ncbi:MAG: lipoate--protein ligase family protein [Thaumarchaeota archaeon]|nr:lipoate--protein ligase family protein [Nitrososphaerota archaeon]
MNMAIDEYLMTHVTDTPIFRIYGWSNPCVSIGYFQSINDIDFQKCRTESVDVVRRITGGGSVFHENELTYSFVSRKYPPKILDSYQEICQTIVSGLNMVGIDAKFSPLNDITVDGKKIGGNAQTRKKGVLLQHGTILLEVDKEKMFSLLKVPVEKISDKKISDVKYRVSQISKTFDQVAESLKDSLKLVFGCQTIPTTLKQSELESCKKIAKDRYSNPDWTFKR